jgi:hypothetical protein
MRKKRHPLSGAIYEDIGNGLVRVEKGTSSGIFQVDLGRKGCFHVEGDLTFADPHMVVWVGGRELPAGLDVNQRRMPIGREMLHD